MSFTVLIVDDEETFRRNAEDFLNARGYETRGVAPWPRRARSLLRGDGDVVLLDVQLPDGYGPTCCTKRPTCPCARRSS